MKRRLVLYSLLLLVYTIFSYSLTAPNLVLTTWGPYWQFQEWLWATFFNQRQLLTLTFLGLSLLLWLSYSLVIAKIKEKERKRPQRKLISWLCLALITSPLLLANNALSYDVFNYIFNAKMVIRYQANPHQQVALNFAHDPWTRFMHNTPTTAPYFYGWTLLSLLPYFFGAVFTGGKFLPTWFSFRLFSFISWLGLIWLGWQKQESASAKQRWWYFALWLNPLVIIEIVANAHNDLWMMLPAVASFLLLTDNKTKTWWKKLVSLVLLGLSISTKLATAALLPLWLILAFNWRWLSKLSRAIKTIIDWIKDNWAFTASILMFLPLLTPRSKQFLPWYLIWSLSWLPFIKNRWRVWKWGLLLLSAGAWSRYLPYLWAGQFDPTVMTQQVVMTWLPFGLYWLIILVNNLFQKNK